MPASLNRQTDRSTAHSALSRVDQLIASEKCKQAVELAKEEHKRFKTPETEQQLVRAYLARIQQFQNKGMAEEAATLLALVRERFPAHQSRLYELEIRSAATAQRVKDLVAPLAEASTPPEVAAFIETNIRQHLVDLPGLAECGSLPAEHPLRVAAGATWRAFQAATAGPVTDEQVALPEVSRRSPLAGWKMLVRAIVAFYRNDDSGCERALEAIPADAAVARLVPLLRALISPTPVPAQGRMAAALRERVRGDIEPLRRALEGIENALAQVHPQWLMCSIQDAVQACRRSQPALYERLRQHISVACAIHNVPPNLVMQMMGSSRKDAYFWRLLARSGDGDGAAISSALYWERFVRHAVQEGLFAAKSLEAAVVYLHAAKTLSAASLEMLSHGRRLVRQGNTITALYEDQPPEIAAVAPRSDRELADTVLAPGWFFQQAAAIHPDPETFRQWWAWAEAVDLPDRFKEDIARRWSQQLPRDPRPLLELSTLAERRDALKLAMKHLTAAEALDSLNPQVRQARLRLTLAVTWRHFKERKAHLVEKDLAELEALPRMGEGDRGAVLDALRAVWHALRGDKTAAARAVEAVVDKTGPLLGGQIVYSVVERAQLPRDPRWSEVQQPALPDPHEVTRAEARVFRLASELGMRISRPAVWDPIINDVLREHASPLSQTDLLMIARGAVDRGNMEQAYLATGAGLAAGTGPAATAGFLLVRARSLAAPWAQRRAAQCLRAAMELARQAHDTALLDKITTEIHLNVFASRALGSGENGGRLDHDTLAKVLDMERAARSYPRNNEDAEQHLVLQDHLTNNRGRFDGFGDYEEDEGFFEEDDEEFEVAEIPRGVDPSMVETLLPLLDNNGNLPSIKSLVQSHPKLLLQMMAAMGGADMPLDEATLKELAERLDDSEEEQPRGVFGRFFGNRKKKKKRR